MPTTTLPTKANYTRSVSSPVPTRLRPLFVVSGCHKGHTHGESGLRIARGVGVHIQEEPLYVKVSVGHPSHPVTGSRRTPHSLSTRTSPRTRTRPGRRMSNYLYPTVSTRPRRRTGPGVKGPPGWEKRTGPGVRSSPGWDRTSLRTSEGSEDELTRTRRREEGQMDGPLRQTQGVPG